MNKLEKRTGKKIREFEVESERMRNEKGTKPLLNPIGSRYFVYFISILF